MKDWLLLLTNETLLIYWITIYLYMLYSYIRVTQVFHGTKLTPDCKSMMRLSSTFWIISTGYFQAVSCHNLIGRYYFWKYITFGIYNFVIFNVQIFFNSILHYSRIIKEWKIVNYSYKSITIGQYRQYKYWQAQIIQSPQNKRDCNDLKCCFNF